MSYINELIGKREPVQVTGDQTVSTVTVEKVKKVQIAQNLDKKKGLLSSVGSMTIPGTDGATVNDAVDVLKQSGSTAVDYIKGKYNEKITDGSGSPTNIANDPLSPAASEALIQFDSEAIGLPAYGRATNSNSNENTAYNTMLKKLKQSMIEFEITPCEPGDFKFEKDSITKFLKLDENKGLTNYWEALKDLGFTSSSGSRGSLKLYAPADSVSGGAINISNSFSDSFLSMFTSFTSSVTSEARQMGLEGALQDLNDFIANKLGFNISKTAGNLGSKIKDTRVGKKFNDLGLLASRMMKGDRLTFPKVWKGGSATSDLSFSINIGYVPVATDSNEEALMEYQKYVVSQIAALAALATPRSPDGLSYSWPFFIKIKSPGVCDYTQAAISSMSITPIEYTSAPFTQLPPMFKVSISVTMMDEQILLITQSPTEKSKYEKDPKSISEDENINSLQRFLGTLANPREVTDGLIPQLGQTGGDIGGGNQGFGDILGKFGKLGGNLENIGNSLFHRKERGLLNQIRGGITDLAVEKSSIQANVLDIAGAGLGGYDNIKGELETSQIQLGTLRGGLF